MSGGALSFSVLFGGRYRHPISATANLSHPNDVEQPDRVTVVHGDYRTGNFLEVNGKLMLIPASNIGSIEITPAPAEPMKWVIRDVQAVA